MRGLLVGLILLLHGHIVAAAPLASLVQAAGLSPSTPPRPAVDFQLLDHEGHTRHLRAQSGKVVFLNFWATWCAPCRHEMPEMEKLFQSFRKRPFVMWAVAMLETREQVVPFFEELQLHFPALLDLEGEVSTSYTVRGLPTTYLIDCVGNIVGHAIGPRQWNNEAVRTLLTALLEDTHCR
jgi:peroxiredoxin